MQLRKLINLTPHTILVYSSSDCTSDGRGSYILRNEDAKPILTIEASGTVARAFTKVEELEPIEFGGFAVPVAMVTYGQPVCLPDYEKGVGYIVSSLTVAAAKACNRTADDLYTVSGTVRDADGRIIGCTGLALI